MAAGRPGLGGDPPVGFRLVKYVSTRRRPGDEPRSFTDILLEGLAPDGGLYVPEQSRRLAAGLPGEVPVHMITSPVGHDAFLTRIHQLDDQLRKAFYAR